MNRKVAVVMAGGSGERFWPVSTPDRPKQFLNLARNDSPLIRDAVHRAAVLTGKDNSFVVTGTHLKEKTMFACPELPKFNLWIEPHKRNTAGALVWVVANIIAHFGDDWPETAVAVLTADQRIEPESEFINTANKALDAAVEHGAIVTIGIRPDRPETGFGYIEVGDKVDDVHKINRFCEKPDLATAEEMIKSGNYLWNSGMFFFTVATFMAELQKAQPDMAESTRSIAGFIAQGEDAAAADTFALLPNLSIDYAVMERTKRAMVIEASFHWDDLGSWDAVSRSFNPDLDGNVNVGSARFVDTQSSVVYNDNASQEVSILGMEDVIVVVTERKILVCPKSRAQDVKTLT